LTTNAVSQHQLEEQRAPSLRPRGRRCWSPGIGLYLHATSVATLWCVSNDGGLHSLLCAGVRACL